MGIKKNIKYQRNHNGLSIVYCFSDSVEKITFEMFQTDNPNATHEEFEQWKRLSDELNLTEKRAVWRQTHKNCIVDMENHRELSVVSAEEAYLAQLENEEVQLKRQQQMALIKSALNLLTEKQRRRYLLHIVHGMTMREIASIENTAAQVVHRSIAQAKKKIQRFVFGDTK